MLLENPDLEAPPSLEALLGARLDRLPEKERAAAERGAVEGQVFHRGAVEELSERRETILAALAGLEAKELVRATDEPGVDGGSAFRFRHILIRDAAYRGLPKRLRASLHERYARWLERVAGDRVAEYGEIVGFHLGQAYRFRVELGPVDEDTRRLGAEAAGWLSAAANRAFVRGDMRAAADLLRQAVSLLEGDAAARLELLPELSKALRYSGDVASSGLVLAEASELAAAVGDRRLQARVELESQFMTLYTDPNVEAAAVIDAAEEASAFFEQHQDEVGLARASNLVGHANWYLCRAAAMEEAFERALAQMHRSGDYRERWWIITQLLCAAAFGPVTPAEGIRRCHDLLALGDGVQSLEMTAAAAIGSLEAMRGNFTEARGLVARSRALGEELGLRQWLGVPRELRRPDRAARRRPARRRGASSGEGTRPWRRSARPACSRRLPPSSRGRSLSRSRFDEAERFADTSVRAGSRDDVYSQVVSRGALARVLAARGELVRAEAARPRGGRPRRRDRLPQPARRVAARPRGGACAPRDAGPRRGGDLGGARPLRREGLHRARRPGQGPP